jgi:hypothetical protein
MQDLHCRTREEIAENKEVFFFHLFQEKSAWRRINHCVLSNRAICVIVGGNSNSRA